MFSPTCCSPCTYVSTLPDSMSVSFDRQLEAQTNLRKSLHLTPLYKACNSSPAWMQSAVKSHSHQCCKMRQSPGNTDKMASLLCRSCLICRSIASKGCAASSLLSEAVPGGFGSRSPVVVPQSCPNYRSAIVFVLQNI